MSAHQQISDKFLTDFKFKLYVKYQRTEVITDATSKVSKNAHEIENILDSILRVRDVIKKLCFM